MAAADIKEITATDPCRQVPRRTEQGPNDRRKESCVETVVGWQVGKLGVRHRLGDQDGENRDPRNQIGLQDLAISEVTDPLNEG
jgi:hypothetical protein